MNARLQYINQYNQLPTPLSKLATSLLKRSLGKKYNKAKFNFAFINDIPKKIAQYKKQLKNHVYPLPPVFKYQLIFAFSDTGIKDYQIYIALDEYLQVMHYNLPVHSDTTIKALYGEKEAIELATHYARQHNLETDVDTVILKYSLDHYTLLWSIIFIQKIISPKEKKCYTVQVSLPDNSVISAQECTLKEEVITLAATETISISEPEPTPPPKR